MKRFQHKVYFENDLVILEVMYSHGSTYYQIKDGESKEIDPLLTLDPEAEDDPYYIDRLDGEDCRVIDILTMNFDYDEIIGKIKFLSAYIVPDQYRRENFSMDIAYSLIDCVDSLKQLGILLEEESYIKKAEEMYEFFDKHFFKRTEELIPADFSEIQDFLSNQIFFLNSIKSH